MELVLEVYHRPPHPALPTLCIDEMTKQSVTETVEPIPASPGQPERQDYTYERKGTANLFMILDPINGWRHVKVTERRTAIADRPFTQRYSRRLFSGGVSAHDRTR